MNRNELWWLTFQKGDLALNQLGFGDEQQLPVLIESDGHGEEGHIAKLSFTLDHIILGMLVALGQRVPEMVAYDKDRSVMALRHFACSNDDPTCRHMFAFAVNYMHNTQSHEDARLLAYVAHAYFGIDDYNVVQNQGEGL